MGSTTSSRKLILYNSGPGTYSYYGLGISSNQLDYNVAGSASHVFYQGIAADCVELFRASPNGNATVGGSLNFSTGKCFIGSVRGIASDAGDATATYISSTGQMTTVPSDRKLKQNIDYNVDAKTIIENLKP